MLCRFWTNSWHFAWDCRDVPGTCSFRLRPRQLSVGTQAVEAAGTQKLSDCFQRLRTQTPARQFELIGLIYFRSIFPVGRACLAAKNADRDDTTSVSRRETVRIQGWIQGAAASNPRGRTRQKIPRMHWEQKCLVRRAWGPGFRPG